MKDRKAETVRNRRCEVIKLPNGQIFDLTGGKGVSRGGARYGYAKAGETRIYLAQTKSKGQTKQTGEKTIAY